MSRMLLLLSVCCAAVGCNTCQNCFDCAYPHYGSIAPRTDRNYGRVGSVFAPAGPDVGELSPYVRETQTVGIGSGIKSFSDQDKDKKPTPAEPTPEEGLMPGDPMMMPDSIDLQLTPAGT